jgi:hypothetical protein
MRKAHPAFHQASASLVRKNVEFLVAKNCVVAYKISGIDVNDEWKNIIVILNSNKKPISVDIPHNDYTIVCSAGKINLNGLDKVNVNKINVAPQSATIMWGN